MYMTSFTENLKYMAPGPGAQTLWCLQHRHKVKMYKNKSSFLLHYIFGENLLHCYDVYKTLYLNAETHDPWIRGSEPIMAPVFLYSKSIFNVWKNVKRCQKSPLAKLCIVHVWLLGPRLGPIYISISIYIIFEKSSLLPYIFLKKKLNKSFGSRLQNLGCGQHSHTVKMYLKNCQN